MLGAQDDTISIPLFEGIPANRLEDLTLRKQAGNLSLLENLALVILAGGSTAEEAAPRFIEQALTAYNHGGYRVPVRAVCDWRKCLFVFTPAIKVSPADAEMMRREFQQLVDSLRAGNLGHTIVIPAGSKIEIFESLGSPAVEVCSPE